MSGGREGDDKTKLDSTNYLLDYSKEIGRVNETVSLV